MTAYVIFIRDEPVQDTAEMAEYQRKNRENTEHHNLKPLAIYGATETLEGPAPDGVLILQFPTVDDARAWYNSPGYQDALPHRQKAANYRAIIVQGI